MADLLDNGARTGTQPWARLHAEGHGEHWTASADYIERNARLAPGPAAERGLHDHIDDGVNTGAYRDY